MEVYVFQVRQPAIADAFYPGQKQTLVKAKRERPLLLMLANYKIYNYNF